VFFIELFKTVTESTGCSGLLDLNHRELSITSEGCGNFYENMLNFFFQCNTREPCDIDNYKKIVKKINKLTDLKYEQLELAIDKFLYKQKINIFNSCTVLEFEDPTVLFHTGYIVCTKATN